MDFQLFCMLKDRDGYIIDENNLYPCDVCTKEYHSKFECPKLHYFPLKQNIVNRYLLSANKAAEKRKAFYRFRVVSHDSLCKYH